MSKYHAARPRNAELVAVAKLFHNHSQNGTEERGDDVRHGEEEASFGDRESISDLEHR